MSADGDYANADFVFGLLDAEELEKMIEDSNHQEPHQWDMCTTCNELMTVMSRNLVCPTCARYVPIVDHGDGYSTTANSTHTAYEGTCSIRVTGEGCQRYNKAMLALTSSPDIVRKHYTRRQLARYNAGTLDGKLPVEILKESAELFNKIQKLGIVRRGNGRLGALAAAISLTCDSYNISKKPKEIAAFLNVSESHVSRGDRMIRALYFDGSLDNLPMFHNPLESFVTQYAELLEIPAELKPCIIDIVNKMDSVLKVGNNNSRTSTKCVGAIYIIHIQKKMQFTKSDIAKQCKISISTFTRYGDHLIQNRKVINPILEQYGIPKLKKKAKVAKV